jgi:4-hydroxy-tetrahydrodipicolinate synthase
MVALTQAALDGRYEDARAANDRLFPIATALMKLDVNPIPIKTALAMQGMMAEEFRLPLCRMEPLKRAELATIMEKNAGLLKPARTLQRIETSV